jgi:2-polyprenyl-3-methyl-5-hydroxy-6-metoxy-1,4-benzoquinol methylase
MVTNMDVLPELRRIMLKGESILDVGCGGTIYEELRHHDWWVYFDFKKRVGIDIHIPEIEWREKHFPNDVFIVMDANNIDRHFLENSFDVVHCQNVVEHLDMALAIQLIRKMEKLAKKQVILGTPKGFRQNRLELINTNPHELHLFAFNKEELENLGYTVIEYYDYFLCYKNMEMG